MIEITYISYLVISIAMTIWVARTLKNNGRIFLVDSFEGNESLADSVNHLLVVGFYLINIGYILLALKTNRNIDSLRIGIEFLSTQIGFVLLVLGGLHFFNIYVIAKWRQRVLSNQLLRAQSGDKREQEAH